MEYSEIVEQMKAGKTVDCRDVNGMQVMQLFLDRILKNVEFGGVLYELNFIPVEYNSSKIFHELNENNCFTFHAASNFIQSFVNSFKNNVGIFIEFKDNYYEIILDILETKE